MFMCNPRPFHVTVQNLLGHSNVKMTSRYAHSDADAKNGGRQASGFLWRSLIFDVYRTLNGR